MSDFSKDKPIVNKEDVNIPEKDEETVEEMTFKEEPQENEDYDESSEDEDEDFKKFDLDIKNSKLMDYHP